MDIQSWITVIILVGIVAYALYLLISKKWTQLRLFAYKLMLVAEKLYQEGQGAEKFEYVFDILYSYIPSWLKIILTEDKIKAQLQKWYDMAKDYLEDGVLDNQ